MDRFRVEVIAQTPNPQRVIYAAMHQDYADQFVFDQQEDWPDEAKCGEIIVKRLLAGERGHFGPLEHPQITFNCGYFPHSVMQQARSHRVGLCLTGDVVVKFTHDSLSQGETYYKTSISELATLWHHGRKHQKTQADADYMKRQISSRKILILDTVSNRLTSSHITNIYVNGDREVYEITTVTGEKIKTTKNHLFWTNQGWLKLSDFNPSTQLCRIAFSGKEKKPVEVIHSPLELTEERWSVIKNYPYYEISTLGRVRSFMPKGGKHRPKEKLKQPQFKKLSQAKKYLFSSFSECPGGVSKRLNIHRLVLETFNPLTDYSKLEVRHINGNSYDNRLRNLRWGTSEENKTDNVRNNTVATNRGEFVDILSVEYSGIEPTYDLEIAHKEHNFIANNLVVHNSFDVQSFRYTGKQFSEVIQGKKDIEDVFYLRPVGNYRDRQGKSYYYSPQQREADIKWCLEAAKRYQIDFEAGMSEEHARGKLPFDYRQHFVVSFNLRSLLHFLDLRYKKNAQLEIQKLCDLMWEPVEAWVPEIAEWYKNSRLGKARLSP